MLKKSLLGVFAIVIILISVVLIKTMLFSKSIPKMETMEIPALPDSAIVHMQAAIKIKTVDYGNGIPIDTVAFEQFWKFVEKSYPLVTKLVKQQSFNKYSRLFTWEGTNPSLKPYVFMAHIDVVPIEKATENQWTVPPFGGLVINDQIYGRGVADDKSSVISLLESVEKLLTINFKPLCTIYLSFGHDEETIGHSARDIASWFTKNNIHPEVVVDEGGEITEENFTELKRPIALIAVAEKGFMSFELSVKIAGGHSSTPANETAIDILTKGLYNLRKKPMPYVLSPIVKEMLQRIGPGLSFMQRMAIANTWLLERSLVKELEKDKNSNALLRTTIVPTIIQSGVKDNVIPGVALATVNTRILPGQTTDEVEAFIKKQMNDDRIQIKRLSDAIKNRVAASYESVAYKKVEAATYKVMKDVIPVPFLSVGATDSKSFQGIADGVIKYLPSIDLKGYHGIDERIHISDLKRMVFFYELMIKDAGK